MKLNAKAACQWLAVPLAAVAIAACGDDSEPAGGPCDGGLEAPCGPEPGTEEYAELYPECGDGWVTTSAGETCEPELDGEDCHPETCVENTCGDDYVGPGENCDSDEDCNDCRDPDCGDGVTDDGEACDDGNAVNDDACTNACNLPECGDSIEQEGEECDEGSSNGNAGGGCTDECMNNRCGDNHVGPGETCDDGNMDDGDECTSDCAPASCGNNVEEEGEECDDGNTNDRDGCLSSCTVAVCGDSEVQMGVEDCDDGNRNNTDGCSNDCVSASCGDGVVQDGEACDEGADNGAPGSSCTANCGDTDCGNGVVEAGEECDDGDVSDSNSCLTSCLWNSCGDGATYTTESDPANTNALEECDDANNSNDDTCTNSCMNSFCGDGFVAPSEDCDEGVDNGVAGGTCTADCELPSCGNGVVEAGEDCDDENDDDTDSCVSCNWNECGDGAIYTDVTDPGNTNPVEACDDENDVNTDACTNACAVATCGDMLVSVGEACDDGNAVNGDGCNDCALGTCGNGTVDPGEDCDDMNPSNTDACLTTCVWNSCGDGFAYLAASVDPANPNAVEACDDANGSNNDACLNTCAANTCGDGFLNPTVETCDNGAMNGPGNVCSIACTPSNCGNGTLDPGEECDDDNDVNTDSCLTTCVWNECGDGSVYVTENNNSNPNDVEQCDDGNDDNSDLCNDTCEYNMCGDNDLLVGWDSEPYDDPDGTGPMTGSRGSAGVPLWGSATPALTDDISPFDFDANSEECDDGNAVNTDACVNSDFDGDGIAECRDADCGDGFVEAGEEQCDEGNNPTATNNNDGCLDTCDFNVCGDNWVYSTTPASGNTAPLEQCDGDANCSATCQTTSCGDGIIQPGEGCDNGALNGTAGNPCGSAASPQGACQISTCGNGTLQTANGEQCDDGNGNNNDQCLDTCRWNVCGDGSPYLTTIAGPTNNVALEECDDGNDNERDACLTACVDAGCGDGFVWFNNEQCDDGNDVEDDECTNSCGSPTCGDGVVHTGEQCDDGGTCAAGVYVDQACDTSLDCLVENFDCVATCVGGPNAGANCTTEANCDEPGVCSDTSTCQAGLNAGDACASAADCPVVADCSFVCNETTGRTGVACNTAAGDDPTVGVDDDSECEAQYGGGEVAGSCSGGFCRTECDADTDCFTGEACLDTLGACDNDDSTCAADLDCPLPDAACSSDTCTNSGSFGNACVTNADCNDNTPSCTGATECSGGVNVGAGCSVPLYGALDNPQCPSYAACTAQDADGCHNALVNGDPGICQISGCGDGILDADEGCEVDSTGAILVPAGVGAPGAGVTCNTATCALSTCGANAGTAGQAEQCDDGNATNTDVCTNRCVNAMCGDGFVQAGEQCDDGNNVETDACTNACLHNVCGDGVRFEGTPTANTGAQQLCDTGDLVNDDPNNPQNVAIFRFTRGRDDADGFDDQPVWCNNQCEVVCDGTNGTNAQPWKTNWCLMGAEEYPLAPPPPGDPDPLVPENDMTDADWDTYTLSWDEAEAYCEDLGIGARLIKLDNASDRDVAWGLAASPDFGLTDAWVGAYDNFMDAPPVPTNPGRFVWLDGTSAQSLFSGGFPGTGGDCAATSVAGTPDGALVDLACGTPQGFFCEYQGPFPRTGAL